jgi:PPM family protein phosphatase
MQAPHLDIFGLTHVGKVREENQDSIRLCSPAEHPVGEQGHLFAVADGMGGFSNGAMASDMAIEALFSTFYGDPGATVIQRLRQGVQEANTRIVQTVMRERLPRMGTTLTAVHLHGRHLHLAHVGDSRVYHVHRGAIRCLTNDHTNVGELVRMRLLPQEKLRTHTQRSVLNRCVGLELFVQPDLVEATVEEGDLLILCTDGLWSVVDDEEIGRMAQAAENMEVFGQRIFDLAMARDSDDNLSVIALRLHALDASVPAPRKGFSLKNLNPFRRTGQNLGRGLTA